MKGGVAIRRPFPFVSRMRIPQLTHTTTSPLRMTAERTAPRWAKLCGVKALSLWLALGFVGLACSWLFPGHFLPWPGFRGEVWAAGAFVLLAVAALSESSPIIWPRIAMFAFAAACIPLVQLAVGQIDFRSVGLVSAAYVAAFATSILVGASLAAGRLRQQLFDGLAACLIFAGIVSSGMALCQWLGPSVWVGLLDPHGGPRPWANIGQPNHLSTQLLLGVAGVLYWYENRRINAWCASFVIAWLGWGVVLTESRTGWLCVAVLALWWWLERDRSSLRLRAQPVAIGIALFALAVSCLNDLHLFVGAVDPAAADVFGIRLKAGTRPMHWAMLWDAVTRSPWIGYGWSQVANAQFAVSANHPATGEWLTQSHNLVLDLLVYNGLPIGLLLSAVLALWVARHAWACNDPSSWCLMLALFMLLTHALLENPLHYAYFLLPAGLLIGILGNQIRKEKQWSTGRWSLALPTAMLLVPLIVVVTEYLQAEEALRDLELAIRGVGRPTAELPQYDWYVLDGWAAYHRTSTMVVSADIQPSQFDELRKVASRYPYPNVLMQYARASVFASKPEEARRTFVHGCKIFGPPTCEAMRKAWSSFQASEPAFRAVGFPPWPG